MPVLRRYLVGALVAAGIGLSGPSAHAQYQGQTLTVASWGCALDKTYQKAFAGFEQKYGVTIKWVPGTTSENAAKVLASRANPEYDIAMLDDVAFEGVSKAGALAKLDPAIVTNLADILPQAIGHRRDGIAIGFNPTGFFYNNVEFAKRGWAPPRVWNDIFRPEFCHHIGFNDPGVSYFFNMTAMLVGGDVSKMKDGIDKFLKLKGCFATLEPSSAKLEEKIQLGEYLVGIHGSVRVVPLAKAGYPVRFVVPEDGTALSYTAAAPVANGPHPKLAQEFINWFLTPETQTILMTDATYVPVNPKVKIPDELRQIGMSGPEAVAKWVELDRDAITEQRRNWARQVERGLAP